VNSEAAIDHRRGAQSLRGGDIYDAFITASSRQLQNEYTRSGYGADYDHLVSSLDSTICPVWNQRDPVNDRNCRAITRRHYMMETWPKGTGHLTDNTVASIAARM